MSSKLASAASEMTPSNCDFGEDVHAADLGGHPELSAFFLDPDDGRLAADPAFLAGSEFGRKDQDQLDIGALFHTRLGIEEYAVRAHVAGLCGVVCTLGRAHARGNAGRDSGSGAALGVSFHRRRNRSILNNLSNRPPTVHYAVKIGREFRARVR